jgi:transcriptional regulator with XRE-family HTH domain
MKIADRIFALLQEKNIPPLDFAYLIGADARDISEWRRGNYNPSLIQIIKTSEYMNVSTDYLLTGEIPEEISVRCPHCDKVAKLKIPPMRDKLYQGR